MTQVLIFIFRHTNIYTYTPSTLKCLCCTLSYPCFWKFPVLSFWKMRLTVLLFYPRDQGCLLPGVTLVVEEWDFSKPIMGRAFRCAKLISCKNQYKTFAPHSNRMIGSQLSHCSLLVGAVHFGVYLYSHRLAVLLLLSPICPVITKSYLSCYY